MDFLGLPGLGFEQKTVLAVNVMFQNAQVVSNGACLASLAAESSSSLHMRCHFLPTVGNSSQMVLGWHLAPAKIDVALVRHIWAWGQHSRSRILMWQRKTDIRELETFSIQSLANSKMAELY